MTNLPTQYQDFIHLSRYARWFEHKKRRETWEETVNRFMNFIVGHLNSNNGYEPSWDTVGEIHNAILNQDIMPSMRALMTAGAALERDNISGFNCSYLPIDHPRAFDETLYILMCGTGVGFSCERQVISKLPEVPDTFEDADYVITVQDSKQGWARAYKQLIASLYVGEVPTWDVSKVRPSGARLKTFGGRASGPAPLIDLFNFTVRTFKAAAGRKLESLEVHDLVCKIGDVVVSGGVRRSALISLSNLSDQRMREAKSGQWWENNAHRQLANNSVAYTEKPEVGQFMEEWNSIYRSKSGERGIFNRQAAKRRAEETGRSVSDGKTEYEFGTNPCGEIILRPQQFCNLTEVVLREDDTLHRIKNKVRLATILGTWQSTLTNYKYIRSIWKKNSEEERLLGVSFTGILDSPVLGRLTKALPQRLEALKILAEETNLDEAERIGIQKSAAITCVKPSGTVSQLVDSASGIHPRHSRFYIRRVRNLANDPLTKFMIEKGFPHEVDNFKPENIVFSFPVESPSTALIRDSLSALDQLELWLVYRDNWCHHNPSITVTVREDEWPEVGAWVWKHFDRAAGISFLPHSDHVYQQAPYEEVDKETLDDLRKQMPEGIDFIDLVEEDDETTSSKFLA